MNKKLFSGLALMSVAATAFWACGEGNINGKDLNDDIAMASNEQDLQTLKDNAIEDCRITPDCYLKYQGYLEGTDVPTSVDNPTSSASLTPQSSNSLIIPGLSSSIKIARSSSSINIIDDPGESSSSGAAPITDDSFGSCVPLKNPINKGEKVQWQFKANSKYPGFDALKIAKATYTWSFAADAMDDGSGKGTTSGNITYPNSGATTASVTVLYDGTPITVACDPLQVNGAAITGCTCEPDATQPDVAGGPVNVTWTVSSCVSTGATVTGYSWTGATGTGETAVAPVSAKGDEVTPVVAVSNDDNTVQEFTCTGVKAIDSSAPDYAIEKANDEVTLPGAGSYTISMGGSSPAGCQIWCKSDTGDSWSASVNGGTATAGTYHAAIANTQASDCGGSMSLTITGASSAITCGANWW